MDNKQLVSIFKTEFSTSIGADDSLRAEREEAMRRYLSGPMRNEVEGQSQVRTSDVSDVVDGVMPSLLRIFTTAENLVAFDAVGPEDIAAADQESDYVSHVFFKENPAFMTLFSWFFDALLQKTGYVAAWWDQSEDVAQESYRNLTIQEVAELLDDPELEPVEREENEDDTHNITFRRVTRSGRARVEPVPPNEMRVSSDTNGLDMSGRLTGRERLMTRSDLVEMGFDPAQVSELKAEQPATRKTGSQRSENPAADKSQEKIRVREGYMKVDFDEDGRAELRQVYTGSDQLLRWADGRDANEIVDRHPFHALCPSPLPHQHVGRSWGEKVGEMQDITSTLLRGALDNLNHTNMPGHAVWESGMSENTMDDLLTTRVGAVRRFAKPPGESYMPMTVPFTAGATFPVLEWLDKVKRDRTGIASDSEGLSPEALKNIQTTVLAQSVDLSKMKVEAIARIFAETGIKSLFRHLHEMLQKHQDKEKVVRLRNQFVTVKPSEWRTRENMTVNIGLGIGTREQNLLHLDAIWQKQTEMAQGGGMNLTVTPRNFYNTAREIVKNANLKDPGMFFTDPGNELAPPPSDEQQQLQAMQAQLEQRRQQLDADRNAINQQKVDLQRSEQELKHQRELFRLEEEREKRQDMREIENEKLRNQLTELQIKVNAEDDPLQDEKTQAEIEKIRADTARQTAEREKIESETRAQELENEGTESGATELLAEMSEDDDG